MASFNKIFYISLGLVFFGLALSLYLAYLYSLPQPITCVIGEVHSCELVRASKYSSFLGIKVPLWGSIYFFFLLLLFVARLAEFLEEKLFLKLISFVVFLGFLFEIYLVYLQAFVLQAFCYWCVLVAIIAFALALIVTYWVYTLRDIFKNNPEQNE